MFLLSSDLKTPPLARTNLDGKANPSCPPLKKNRNTFFFCKILWLKCTPLISTGFLCTSGKGLGLDGVYNKTYISNLQASKYGKHYVCKQKSKTVCGNKILKFMAQMQRMELHVWQNSFQVQSIQVASRYLSMITDEQIRKEESGY